VIFDDINLGDSIAVNGVCLTLEAFDSQSMTFTLGFETLKVLGSESGSGSGSGLETWLSYPVNLERSLSFGARVHGHFVTGHTEKMLRIVKSEALGDNWLLGVELTPELKEFCWKKGSVALNGVSLTINSIENLQLEVCLIPETQKRTNLSHYKMGEMIGFEPDSFAKAISHVIAQRAEHLEP
jgi:riboflavin synthase